MQFYLRKFFNKLLGPTAV